MGRLWRRTIPFALPTALAATIVIAGKILLPMNREAAVSPGSDVVGIEKAITEVVFVFIASSRCAAMRNEEVREAVLEVRDSVKVLASRIGARAVTMGVAIDFDQGAGISMLSKLGPWDEVAVGRNWLNAAVIHYVWRDVPGSPAIPQILLLRRTVRSVGDEVLVGDDSLLIRLVGGEEVMSWVTKGGVKALEQVLVRI